MALGPRLDLRQSQSLVMTPQLQQAIKLLALSNLKIESFISDHLESNPLLEAGEIAREPGGDDPIAPSLADGPENQTTLADQPTADALILAGAGEADAPLDLDPAALDHDRDTGDWSNAPGTSGAGGLGEDGAGFDLENQGAAGPSLADHLLGQIGAATRDTQLALIAGHLVGLLDEAGYLSTPLREVASDLGVDLARAEEALALIQSLDPAGVGARSLGECLAIQAREADRHDPCMAALLDNLDLVARGALAQLRRVCRVDDEDLADMLAELRRYDPRPGLRFGGSGVAAVVPDILLSRAETGNRRDGGDGGEPGAPGWIIRLNEATLPRLVVNRDYYLELRQGATSKEARGWLNEKLADANWLIKALDQRQKTILKVAAEIARRQDGFFRHGVSELRPLTLRAVAEAIGMHESTVSRVTSNKYLACERGTFELKFFFTSGVGGGSDGEGASAEAVKARIRALIEAEAPEAIVSDDTLVALLRAEGFDLARRTVAKYREAIGIGSSVQRRRAKRLMRP